MLGADLTVKTLYGDVKMKIDPGSQNEDKKKIEQTNETEGVSQRQIQNTKQNT